MDWIFLITLLALGLMAAADKLAEIIPPSKQLTDFFKQSEAWIGTVSIALSVYQLIRFIMHLGVLLKHAKIFALIQLTSVALLFLLGVFFAQSLLRRWTANRQKVTPLINRAVDIAAPIKELLGFVAIVVSLIYLGLIL